MKKTAPETAHLLGSSHASVHMPTGFCFIQYKEDFDRVVCIVWSCPLHEICHYEFWVVLYMPKAFFSHCLVLIKLLVKTAQKSSLRGFEDYHLLLSFCRDTKVSGFEVLLLM